MLLFLLPGILDAVCCVHSPLTLRLALELQCRHFCSHRARRETKDRTDICRFDAAASFSERTATIQSNTGLGKEAARSGSVPG